MADGGRVRDGSEFQVAVGGHGLLLRNPAHGYERGDDPGKVILPTGRTAGNRVNRVVTDASALRFLDHIAV